jgi:hypothetical protein
MEYLEDGGREGGVELIWAIVHQDISGEDGARLGSQLEQPVRPLESTVEGDERALVVSAEVQLFVAMQIVAVGVVTQTETDVVGMLVSEAIIDHYSTV